MAMDEDATTQRMITTLLLQHNTDRLGVHHSKSIYTPKKAVPILFNRSTKELTDLLAKNQALLQNRGLVSRLPDRGAKLHNAVQTIESLLEERKIMSSLESYMERLSIQHDNTSISNQKRTQRQLKTPGLRQVKVLSMQESLEVARQAYEREKEEAIARTLAKVQTFTQHDSLRGALARLQNAYTGPTMDGSDDDEDEYFESDNDNLHDLVDGPQ